MSVMRPALKPPQTRIHQKHSRENVTVALVELEKTDVKKEEQKVDHVLTQRCGRRSGASQTPTLLLHQKFHDCGQSAREKMQSVPRKELMRLHTQMSNPEHLREVSPKCPACANPVLGL